MLQSDTFGIIFDIDFRILLLLSQCVAQYFLEVLSSDEAELTTGY